MVIEFSFIIMDLIFSRPRLRKEATIMSKVVFVFFFLMGLILLYLTILVEHQFIVAGICP
jgi:hypothetical protein